MDTGQKMQATTCTLHSVPFIERQHSNICQNCLAAKSLAAHKLKQLAVWSSWSGSPLFHKNSKQNLSKNLPGFVACCQSLTFRSASTEGKRQRTFSIFLFAVFLPHSRLSCSLIACNSLPKWIILSMAAWLPPQSWRLNWLESTSARTTNHRQ